MLTSKTSVRDSLVLCDLTVKVVPGGNAVILIDPNLIQDQISVHVNVVVPTEEALHRKIEKGDLPSLSRNAMHRA